MVIWYDISWGCSHTLCGSLTANPQFQGHVCMYVYHACLLKLLTPHSHSSASGGIITGMCYLETYRWLRNVNVMLLLFHSRLAGKLSPGISSNRCSGKLVMFVIAQLTKTVEDKKRNENLRQTFVQHLQTGKQQTTLNTCQGCGASWWYIFKYLNSNLYMYILYDKQHPAPTHTDWWCWNGAESWAGQQIREVCTNARGVSFHTRFAAVPTGVWYLTVAFHLSDKNYLHFSSAYLSEFFIYFFFSYSMLFHFTLTLSYFFSLKSWSPAGKLLLCADGFFLYFLYNFFVLFANNYLEIHMPTDRRLNHSARRYGKNS